MKLDKLLANLGYGSRKEMAITIKNGWLTDAAGTILKDGKQVPPCPFEELRFDGAPLDPPQGSLIMLNKPVGYTCSTKDQGALVYQLLPDRFLRRKPPMSSVGRLDKDTSGLLLFTDDGKLLHRLISPKSELAKTYRVTLERPLSGNEIDIFASGTLMLRGETTPLKPAKLSIDSETMAHLTITEGRYHQVRRMFAATGNHVSQLHRTQIGALTLENLAEGQWQTIDLASIYPSEQKS
ncbi:pseudouridine synthase [Polycladidibacter stylochi]|uniref:pseudouridine synthase n=1 Tax=Polycladidibacter stylochi TaxID=1807766 RepID=UPI00082E0FCE|nr:pseudouridine synthase [Pseudovibrio stylochi]